MMNWKNFFLIVGVPLLIFYGFVITIYYAFISGLLLIFFIVGLCCLRKKHFWRRLSKLSIAMFICFFVVLSNPLIWPDQFYRHVNPSVMITPQAPAVTALNDTTELWNYIENVSIPGYTQSQFLALTESRKLELISDYCLDKIDYLNIHYQYYVFDRIATPTEAITTGTGDCQAHAVVTTSLLIYLGYNAYAAETPFHWYTVVFLDDGTPIYLNRLLGNGIYCSAPEFLMNDRSMLYTMNFAWLVVDVVFAPHFNNTFDEVFQDPLYWIIFPIALLAIAAIFTAVIKLQDKPTKKEFLRNTLLTGLVLNVGFVLWTALSFFILGFTVLILLVTVVLALQLLSHDFFLKTRTSTEEKLKDTK